MDLVLLKREFSDMEQISLENLENTFLKKILDKYLINCTIDTDGDILVDGSIPVFISIDHERNILRFFGSINTKYLNKTIDDLFKFTSKINMASNSVKYSSIKGNESIFFEYGIFTFGSIDDVFFVNTLKNILNEINDSRALFPLIDEMLSKE